MASSYWIKLYHEILDDPKMGLLPDNVWRRCIELFLLAGSDDAGGQLPDTKTIAWRLRQPSDKLAQEIEHLRSVGILEENQTGWFIVNFSDRQAAISSTERSRRSRELSKNQAMETATNRCATGNKLPKNWAYQIYKNIQSTPGIYRIYYLESGLSYVGASKDMRQRIKQHLSEITGTHHKMSADFAEYGPEVLKVEILEQVSSLDDLPARETFWIEQYRDSLYNTEKSGKFHRDRLATNRCTDIDIDIDIDKDNNQNKKEEVKKRHPDFGKVCEVYQYEIGGLSQAVSDALNDDIEVYSSAWVIDAMKRAAKANKRSLNYVEGILKNWQAVGGPQNDKPQKDYSKRGPAKSQAEGSPLPSTPADLPAPVPLSPYAEIWEQAQSIIMGQMTKSTFDAWVSGTQAEPNSNGTFILKAKSPEAKQWIDNRLSKIFLNALRSVKPDISKLEVIVQ